MFKYENAVVNVPGHVQYVIYSQPLLIEKLAILVRRKEGAGEYSPHRVEYPDNYVL